MTRAITTCGLLAATILALLAAISVLALPAEASRRANSWEIEGIRNAVMRECWQGNNECHFNSGFTRVSSISRLYARSAADGDNFAPTGVLKRKRGTRRWHWVIHQSGGLDRCRNYRKKVPARILRELNIRGMDGRC